MSSERGAARAKPADAATQALKPFAALVAQMELAWNKGDARSFAAVFGEQADFIHILGGHGLGRATIEQVHRQMFETVYAKSRVEYRIEKVKPLAPTVAVVFLNQKLTFFRDGQSHDLVCRPTAVVRKGPEGWRIAVFQNTKVADLISPEALKAIDEAHPARKR